MLRVVTAGCDPYLKYVQSLFKEYADSLGFKDIEPYRYNPIKGARFMELNLMEFDIENTGDLI